MKYCKNCVQTDTRPGIKFNDQGICPACQYMDKAKRINWEKRDAELQKIIEFGKTHNISGYDCIVGVSGGKDSTRQAMYVRDVLGLKPLLVSCNYPPEQQTERGADNISNLAALGFDVLQMGPAPQTWKKLFVAGLRKYGNFAKSTEMALYASLPRTAIAYHIPLVFLGENPAIQLGDLGVGSTNWNANKMRESNTIKSGPTDLMQEGMTEQDIIWYRYPSYEETEKAEMMIVYLGYFWKDFTKIDNALFSISHGLEIREDTMENMGDLHPFEALDDDFVFVNQYLKNLKLGFGKITDCVCEEIRFGRMSRERGLELVKKYDGNCSDYYIEHFSKYCEISTQEFHEIAESYRNKDLWEKVGSEWRLKEHD